MSRGLFLILPGHGHVNPTIGLVNELVNKGDEIVYITAEEFRDKLEKVGAKFLGYELKDDVLTLNFNNFIFDDTDKKSILEEVIYSICLSVRDNYSVKEVIFTVNGNEITKSVLKNIE